MQSAMENVLVACADMGGTHVSMEKGIVLPHVQLHSLSASGELNVNPCKPLLMNTEKAIKCFLPH